MDYQGVWILAEQTDGQVTSISHELLTRGRELADKRKTSLTAMLLGTGVSAEDLQELIDRGADRVIYVDSKALTSFLPEPYGKVMLWLIDEYKPEIIIAGATSTGRTLMPYVAIKAHAGLTADCTVLDIEEETGNLLQTRPAIGGNIMATIKTPAHRPQMATVRPKSTRPAAKTEGRTGEILRLTPPAELLASKVKRVGFVANEEEHSIQDADMVVACGRGLKKAENLAIVDDLADSLAAAVGATRDVVDRGWMSYSHQIGLSGKTITPKLYIGMGLSGSIQHIAGMQTSDLIISVNNDPDAPIFKISELAVVADMFEFAPVLTEKIRQAKKG